MIRHGIRRYALVGLAAGAAVLPAGAAQAFSTPGSGQRPAESGATAVSSASPLPGARRPAPQSTESGATAVSSASLLPGVRRPGVTGTDAAPAARVVHASSTASGFDWGDAGIGAGGALALALLAVGAASSATHRRHRHAGPSGGSPLAG